MHIMSATKVNAEDAFLRKIVENKRLIFLGRADSEVDRLLQLFCPEKANTRYWVISGSKTVVKRKIEYLRMTCRPKCDSNHAA